jgi:hypothetical protein
MALLYAGTLYDADSTSLMNLDNILATLFDAVNHVLQPTTTAETKYEQEASSAVASQLSESTVDSQVVFWGCVHLRHLGQLRGLTQNRRAGIAPGPPVLTNPVRAEALLLRVFGDHVDGPLAARIARVGGDVKADALPDLQHLEPAVGDRGVMEEELAAP